MRGGDACTDYITVARCTYLGIFAGVGVGRFWGKIGISQQLIL